MGRLFIRWVRAKVFRRKRQLAGVWQWHWGRKDERENGRNTEKREEHREKSEKHYLTNGKVLEVWIDPIRTE